MFQLQNAASERLELPDLKLEPLSGETRTTKFELHLAMARAAGGLTVEVGYRRDLFDRSTIQRLARHWRLLLESVVDDPAQRVSELDVLSLPERHQLLHEWQDTEGSAHGEIDLVTLIEAQVRRVPEATALVFEGASLSFGELDRRANRLAHELLARGLEPEMRVGVTLERSLELVVALVAVLKAGGAYVPLDPQLPVDRLAEMIADAAPRVIVTLSGLRQVLPEAAREVLCLDSEAAVIASRSPSAPEIAAGPHHLAYVIFTSGSTGRPKGVMNRRGAVTNRLLWMQEIFGIGEGDRLLQKTPYSFDVSVWEFFSPLIAGAILVVARPEGHRDPDYLVSTVVRHRITLVHFVASMLRVFLEAPKVASCDSLRLVVTSGEAVTPDLVEAYYRQLTPAGGEAVAPLENLYGPTEAAVDVSRWSCTPANARGNVPIGRPVENVRLEIVDRCLRPVANRSSGGVADRRGPGGAGLYRASGADRRAFRAAASWLVAGPCLPHRRPGAFPCRRCHRVSRSDRPAGEAAGFPYRVGRDRARPGGTSGGAECGGIARRAATERSSAGGLGGSRVGGRGR